MRYCVSQSRGVSPDRSCTSLTLRLLCLGALGGFLAISLAASAQSNSAAAPGAPAQIQHPSTSTPPPAINDPRHPEVQPSLTVDRDPIPSPDANFSETSANVPATPNAPSKPGEIQKGQNGVYTLHENVDEVLLNCTVIDQKGHPVEGLTQKDFRVWEDNAPQRISSFRFQDMPVSMGLLVDNSGSMLDKRAAVNAAAMTLLRDSNREDTAFVVNFNEHAYLDQGFTSSLVALDRGLSHFDSKGTTALYDAVAASADELAKHAKFQKQVLLIVSDGADNASRLTEQEAVRRVQSLGGPVIYSIGLLYDTDPKEYQQAHDALQTLSDDTGGLAYFPRSLDEVNQIATDVAKDIRNQYTIGYHSTKPVSLGGYRVVHVEAFSPKLGRLIVRTRRGYYARPGVSPNSQQAASRPAQ